MKTYLFVCLNLKLSYDLFHTDYTCWGVGVLANSCAFCKFLPEKTNPLEKGGGVGEGLSRPLEASSQQSKVSKSHVIYFLARLEKINLMLQAKIRASTGRKLKTQWERTLGLRWRLGLIRWAPPKHLRKLKIASWERPIC